MGVCNCIGSKPDMGLETNWNKFGIDFSKSDSLQQSQNDEPLLQFTINVPEITGASVSIIQVQALFRQYLAQSEYLKNKLLIAGIKPKVPEEVLNLLSRTTKHIYLSLGPYEHPYFLISSLKEFIKFPDGSLYAGQMNRFGQPEGLGEMYYQDGGVYEGTWSKGLHHGEGRKISSQGDVYIGQWRYGKMHGKGKINYASNNSYEGDWENDLQDGFGVEIWGDASKFEGSYKNGLKNGNGKFLWPDGSYYFGEFKNDQIDGRGKYVWLNRSYEGDWKESKMHGKGIFFWDDGKKYEGEYVNGQKHGWGTFVWPGKIYDGFWAEGKQHGEGSLTQQGRVTTGIWIHGKLVRSNADMLKGGNA